MSEKRAVDIVDKQLEYYNSHDIEGFVSTYSKDIEIFNQGETEPFLVGREALRERYLQRFSNPKLHANIVNRMTNGCFVIDHEHVEGLLENGVVKAIAIYEVRENLIQRVWFIME